MAQHSNKTYRMIISVLPLEASPTSITLAAIPNLNEYKLVDNLLIQDHRIVVPDHLPTHTNILKMCHNHPLAGHYSVAKTMELLNQHYYWLDSMPFVQKYNQSCTNCGQAKVQQHKPHKLLHLLSNINYNCVCK
jgi:ribosomal protein S27AE